jgi:hypothetical protein
MDRLEDRTGGFDWVTSKRRDHDNYEHVRIRLTAVGLNDAKVLSDMSDTQDRA